MSNNNARKKLLKASTEASEKGGVQHVLAIVKADGSLDMSGSDNIVSAILNNVSFYQNLKDILTTSRQNTGNILPSHMLSFPLLPCSPSSKEWKGSKMLRGVVDSYVTAAGYGKYGNKLGQGVAPPGWPADVPWAGYTGAGSSGLKNNQLTKIIIGMLQAAGINPVEHVKQDEEPEADDHDVELDTGVEQHIIANEVEVDTEASPQADDHDEELDTGEEQHIIVANEVEIDTETTNNDTAVFSVAKNQEEEGQAITKPKPGEKGWLEYMAKKMVEKEGGSLPPPTASLDTDQVKTRPKPGEKGWLVALAESMESTSTQESVLSSSQLSNRKIFSGEMSSQQLGSQEVGKRPKPGEPGWLMALADSMENPSTVQHNEGASSQQSVDMFSRQTGSQEVLRLRERGWSVSIAESWEEAEVGRERLQKYKKKTTPSQQDREMMRSSQDNEKGATISQDSRKGKSVTTTPDEESTTDDGDGGSKAEIDMANGNTFDDDYGDLAQNDVHSDAENNYMIEVNIATEEGVDKNIEYLVRLATDLAESDNPDNMTEDSVGNCSDNNSAGNCSKKKRYI